MKDVKILNLGGKTVEVCVKKQVDEADKCAQCPYQRSCHKLPHPTEEGKTFKDLCDTVLLDMAEVEQPTVSAALVTYSTWTFCNGAYQEILQQLGKNPFKFAIEHNIQLSDLGSTCKLIDVICGGQPCYKADYSNCAKACDPLCIFLNYFKSSNNEF